MNACRLVCILVCMLAAMQAGAQVRISGTVREKDGGPQQSAVVLYVPAGQEGSEYAITDGMGKFSLELEAAPAAGDSLRVSMLGYGTVTVAPEAGTEMEILLSEEAISIQEVVVRAPKVKLYGDTVEFNVQSFAEAQDKSLSDVLKRMPGVEVGEDGEISYNGESLGNLYVEGMDLLGGRYSLLTKNISARDVKSVEIIEKHQPVKALSGISSGDKPAINLKLQESAKGKWVGSANLAGGVSSAPEALWDANLFLMRVGRKWQSVNNIKTNNIGKELKSELNGYGILGSAADNRPSGFVSIGTGSAPLDADRVSFNQSGIINSSNNFRTAEDWKLNASVSYSFDRLESGNSSSTTYYFEDGEKTVLEGNEAMTREHFLQGRFEAEANRPDFYFRNVLSAEAGYSDGLVSMTGEYPNRQKAVMPYISVGDDLQYTGRRGNRAFTVYSSNRFAMGSENLTVIREDGVQKQDVGIRDFGTDTYVSTDFKVSPRLGFGLKGGLEASVRSLESLLEGVDTAGLGLAGASFSNCLTAAFVRPYISPGMEYNSRHWELRLSAPVSYARYWFADADRFIYRTFGSVKYIPGPKLSFTVSGSASNSALDIDDFYTGYILQNYRYMKTGSVNTDQDESYSVSGRINYKDPVNLFYLDGTVRKSWNVYATSSTQDFLGDYIVTGTESAMSKGSSWYAVLSGSIGIYGINGKAGLSVSYTDFSTTSILQNGVRTPYLSRTIGFSPTLEGRFAPWLGVNYALSYSRNILSLPGTSTSEGKDRFNHTLELRLTPVKGLDITVSGEHYYTVLAEDYAKNTVLVDAAVSYRFKGGIELSLTARNLLDQRTYAYSVFSGLSSYSCEYLIRPFNILAGIHFSF